VERLGVTEVRFTGGEPLLRRGLPGLVAAAAALDPRPEISLTTHGGQHPARRSWSMAAPAASA